MHKIFKSEHHRARRYYIIGGLIIATSVLVCFALLRIFLISEPIYVLRNNVLARQQIIDDAQIIDQKTSDFFSKDSSLYLHAKIPQNQSSELTRGNILKDCIKMESNHHCTTPTWIDYNMFNENDPTALLSEMSVNDTSTIKCTSHWVSTGGYESKSSQDTVCVSLGSGDLWYHYQEW